MRSISTGPVNSSRRATWYRTLARRWPSSFPGWPKMAHPTGCGCVSTMRCTSMADAHDPRSVIEQAERAAGAGDYLAAERLLRDAASRQEAALGPFHPDLVNTLNNLAVVYETIDQPADGTLLSARVPIAMTSLAARSPVCRDERKKLQGFLRRSRHSIRAADAGAWRRVRSGGARGEGRKGREGQRR